MRVKAFFSAASLICLSFLVIACSQAPVPVSQPYGFQDKMEAAKHWQIVARDVSNDISEMFVMLDEQYQQSIHDQRVHIMTRDTSSFSQALESFMVTDLTHQGVRVTNNPEDAYQVYWSVQSVTHDASRSFTKAPPGTYVALGALGYGVYKIFRDSTDFARAVTAGAVVEVGRGLAHFYRKELPHNEIIVNLTIQHGDDIVYRLSNIYYINDPDIDHYHFSKDLYYASKDVQTRTVQVTGRVAPEPELEDVMVFSNVQFDFDRAEIKPEYAEILREAARQIKDRQDPAVVVEGHTCNIGPAEYNMGLSERRAQAVADFLVEQNVDRGAIETRGYGLTRPAYDNDTREGRALNRRVEMRLLSDRMAAN